MPTESRQPGATEARPARAVSSLPAPARQLLQRAAALYARGNLSGAEGLCRQLLQLESRHADALHILGLVAWRRGDRQQATDEIKEAIASDPTRPQPHNSLGVLLKEAGDLAGAEAAFRTAIGLQANYSEAITNLGNILCEAGKLAEAEAMHRRVVELAPEYAEGHNNLATALAKQERWDEAVEECRLAVEREPAKSEFQLNLGRALSALNNWREAAAAFQRAADLALENADAHANLGIALYYLNEPERAAAAHRTATGLLPASARIWTNLAAAQVDLGNADEALNSCRTALHLDPNSPEAHNCRGSALVLKGSLAEAIQAYETAIRLRPDDPRAYTNLGNLLHSQARFEAALAAHTKAIEMKPEHSEAQCNKGMLHLLLGEFDPGWRGYEQGLQMRRPRARLYSHHIKPWEGAPIAGRTILVSTEQGIGDQIMFASMLPDLIERGATCMVMLDERLYPLLRRSIGGLTLLARDDTTLSSIEQLAIDYQAPMGSLCRWLRPNLASFPLTRGYLKADPAAVQQLRQRYRKRCGDRPLVGVSWRGGTGEMARVRSVPLEIWSPILNQSEFGFVNLQYGPSRADLAVVRKELGIEVLHDEQVDPLTNLDDFAAQTAAMDLVISIDNSTVHMAGALNVPVWALLPAVPDWRWMLNRSDSPWYPSARLFRQPGLGDWSSVFAAVAEELKREVESAGPRVGGHARPNPPAG